MKTGPEYLSDQELFSQMSKGDLRTLGVGDVGYVKRHAMEGQTAFVLYAADGTVLSIQKSETTAHRSALDSDIDLVAVH